MEETAPETFFYTYFLLQAPFSLTHSDTSHYLQIVLTELLITLFPFPEKKNFQI